MRQLTHYEMLEASPERRRRLRQEELILEVTEALAWALKQRGISRAELADRMGRAKSFVTQLFGGSRNLTLRTIADVCDALNCRIKVQVVPNEAEEAIVHSWVSYLRTPHEVSGHFGMSYCFVAEAPAAHYGKGRDEDVEQIAEGGIAA